MNNHDLDQQITAMLREGLREMPAQCVGDNMAATVVAALAGQPQRHRGSMSRLWRQSLSPGLIGAALSLAITRACLPSLLDVPPVTLSSIPMQNSRLTETAFAYQEGLQIDLTDPNGAAFTGSYSHQPSGAAAPPSAPSGIAAPARPSKPEPPRGVSMTAPATNRNPQRET